MMTMIRIRSQWQSSPSSSSSSWEELPPPPTTTTTRRLNPKKKVHPKLVPLVSSLGFRRRRRRNELAGTLVVMASSSPSSSSPLSLILPLLLLCFLLFSHPSVVHAFSVTTTAATKASILTSSSKGSSRRSMSRFNRRRQVIVAAVLPDEGDEDNSEAQQQHSPDDNEEQDFATFNHHSSSSSSSNSSDHRKSQQQQQQQQEQPQQQNQQQHYPSPTSLIPASLLLQSTDWHDDCKPRRSAIDDNNASPFDHDYNPGRLPREKFFPNNEWGIHYHHSDNDNTSSTSLKSSISSSPASSISPSLQEQINKLNASMIASPTLSSSSSSNSLDHNSSEASFAAAAAAATITAPSNNPPTFPATLEQAAESAARAILQEVMQPPPKQDMVNNNKKTKKKNAYQKSGPASPNRVPMKQHGGRLAIELDDAQYLFSNHNHGYDISSQDTPIKDGSYQGRQVSQSQNVALRQFSLVLAQKLATTTLLTPENDENDGDDNNDVHGNPHGRPVALYLNTIKQTMLAASAFQELERQQPKDDDEGKSRSNTQDNQENKDNDIFILTLGDDLPAIMRQYTTQGYRTSTKGQQELRSGPRAKPAPDVRRGFVIVVQPTDYNQEHEPPGPSIGTLGTLQQLCSHAAVVDVTVILVSPRFLALPHWQSNSNSVHSVGKNPRQMASWFGGGEPVRQPSPWLLHDFSPPIWSWVGAGLDFSSSAASSTSAVVNARRIRGHALRHEQQNGRYVRVALWQSAPNEAWHIFGLRRKRRSSSTQSPSLSSASSTSLLYHYDYLASTDAQAGRPNREIMQHIFADFADDGDDRW